MAQQRWPNVARIVRLPRGLYAINSASSRTVKVYGLSDISEHNVVHQFEIEQFGALYNELDGRGLTPLGVDFYSDRRQVEGIDPPESRHFFRSNRGDWPVNDAAQIWKEIAHASTKGNADISLIDLCQRIAFELRASSSKWFDISRSYNRTLNGLLKRRQFVDEQRFDDGNAFFVYLAIHSFFAEIATLRDYIAEFIAQYIISNDILSKSYISKMQSLAKEVRKNPGIQHPLAADIISFTDEGSHGWLAELSAFRDLVIHHAPATMTRGRSFMMAKAIEVKDGISLPGVAFYLPADPFEVKRARARGSPFKTFAEWIHANKQADSSTGREALEYCHSVLGQMAELTLKSVDHSPVMPMPIVVEQDQVDIRE